MKLILDFLPDDLVAPYGPIDIIDGAPTWDERYGECPSDLVEWVAECSAC